MYINIETYINKVIDRNPDVLVSTVADCFKLYTLILPGVLVILPGVLGVLAGVLLDNVDLFKTFIGVFPDILRFEQALSVESLQVLSTLSFILRCQRISGPLLNGASILSKLFMSFSKLKCDISSTNNTSKKLKRLFYVYRKECDSDYV